MSQTQLALGEQALKNIQAVLPGVIDQYRQNPEKALTHFEVSTRVVHGTETEVTGRGFKITIDEPASLGGTNKGLNPVEVLLGSLGTCQEIVLVAYAAALGIKLDKVEIKASGDIDLRGLFSLAEVPAGFKNIHFDVNIEARDATPAQLEQLKALGLGHCPVLDTLQRPIPVTSTYHLAADGK